jgi:hypothetical protein
MNTSGCPWPKATMKSPMGACNLRPLFFIFSYFLLLIFYCPGHPALPLPCPCPCLALPLPLPLPLPCFEFSFCCQGQEEEVIQGTGSFFFPFAARDRRRKLHMERMGFRTWTDRHSGVRSVVALPHRRHLFFFFFFPRGRLCAFGFRDSWRWSQVRRFTCGRDG